MIFYRNNITGVVEVDHHGPLGLPFPYLISRKVEAAGVFVGDEGRWLGFMAGIGQTMPADVGPVQQP